MEMISKTKAFVMEILRNAEPGHDILHAFRVHANALKIAEEETCNKRVVELSALLHDIADAKFNDGNETQGSEMARAFLQSIGLPDNEIFDVIFVIDNISFRKGQPSTMTPELAIVQDADRLDAIGAIGIARAFSYGGFKCRPFYDKTIMPCTKASIDNPNTINHFYEKLLLLRDLMNTKTGRNFALQRHEFIELYLQQFWAEASTE